MNGVHHTPFSRIKSQFANITEDDARARGYIKGKQKKEEIFTLLKRTTSPQTIYKKQKLDKDDITDITDFDVVAWIKAEMRVMLDEEIARAVLIGDGRATDSDDHISEEHIRPIAKDVDLFNIKVDVSVPSGKPGVMAKNFIDAVIRNRKYYKGSGTPTMFTTADMLTEMLLLEDGIGHKLYKSVQELATALRVSNIVEVEVMEGQKINGKDLAAVIVNLDDYNIGADKGGAVDMFDDFDDEFEDETEAEEENTNAGGVVTIDLNAQAKEILKKASEKGVEQAFMFTTAFRRYTELISHLADLQKEIKKEGLVVTKTYVKNRPNIYVNPAVNAYNATAAAADRTAQLLLRYIVAPITGGGENGDAFDVF